MILNYPSILTQLTTSGLPGLTGAGSGAFWANVGIGALASTVTAGVFQYTGFSDNLNSTFGTLGFGFGEAGSAMISTTAGTIAGQLYNSINSSLINLQNAIQKQQLLNPVPQP